MPRKKKKTPITLRKWNVNYDTSGNFIRGICCCSAWIITRTITRVNVESFWCSAIRGGRKWSVLFVILITCPRLPLDYNSGSSFKSISSRRRRSVRQCALRPCETDMNATSLSLQNWRSPLVVDWPHNMTSGVRGLFFLCRRVASEAVLMYRVQRTTTNEEKTTTTTKKLSIFQTGFL